MSGPDAGAEPIWQPLRAAIMGLLRPLRPEDGVPEERIAGAERRLGRRLPRRLREYYLIAGAWERLNRGYNRLQTPEELEIVAGALVFYIENEDVCVWGVLLDDLGLDDPPVVRANNDDRLAWEPDHARVSDFFVSMTYLNAVNGTAAHVGVGSAGPETVAILTSSWTPIPVAAESTWDVRLFGGDGRVVCLAGEDGPLVQAAAITADGLRVTQESLGIDWDYSTIDEPNLA